MPPFFSDRLVPIPNSEGGSLIFSPSSNMIKLEPNQIPPGASAMLISTTPISNKMISFDGIGVVGFAPNDGNFDNSYPMIYGRSMIEATGFGNGGVWYIQFFRTS